MEVDAAELRPMNAVLDDGGGLWIVAVVAHADEYADFEARGGGVEYGVDDFGAVHVWLGEDADVEAAFDVFTILCEAVVEDGLGTLKEGVGGGEYRLGDLGEDLGELGEVVVAKVFVPHVGDFTEEVGCVLLEEVEWAGAFEVEVGFCFGEVLDEGF